MYGMLCDLTAQSLVKGTIHKELERKLEELPHTTWHTTSIESSSEERILSPVEISTESDLLTNFLHKKTPENINAFLTFEESRCYDHGHTWLLVNYVNRQFVDFYGKQSGRITEHSIKTEREYN